MPTNHKLIQIHDQLADQVQALIDSQDWREFLTVASRFHRYSTNNVLLILAQRPDATRVAGYRAWQRLGRQVRKGERGIAILAPYVQRARPVDDHDAAENPEVVRILRGFRVAHVWDIFSRESARFAASVPMVRGAREGFSWPPSFAASERASFPSRC